MRPIILGLAVLCLSGCASFTGAGPGNPDGTAYAGGAGSVYSTADNSPKTMGVVSYDPNAVQPMPAEITPTPAGSAAVNGTLPAQDYGPAARDPQRPAAR